MTSKSLTCEYKGGDAAAICIPTSTAARRKTMAGYLLVYIETRIRFTRARSCITSEIDEWRKCSSLRTHAGYATDA
jgi:hypothetical protein